MSDEDSWLEQARNEEFGWSEELVLQLPTSWEVGCRGRYCPEQELEQELVQMCLADYYVGISNFSPWSHSAVQPDKAVTVVEGCKSNCTWWKQ